MDKLRLYVGSIMAFNQLDPRAPAGGNVIDHLPFAVVANSIEAAAADAKKFAFENYPISETWYAHQAKIAAVDQPVYDMLFEAVNAEMLDPNNEGEEGKLFQFDV